MFVAVYRTSILSLGVDEEEAVSQALRILKKLPNEESAYISNHLKIFPVSEQACNQIIYKKSISLRIKNGVVGSM
ncbi:hypothetical protein PsAD2_02953 [Pseudovibrio axinellae]|uniref:Uncharacterized protein n=1 Tax=Pseudovibrio axinellae TaxID=989403 RepID=A0A165XE13_9HYPH|nr:hypothetical protein [Pseudovibrio axinellae]KZL17617.1 hypothetical protein PsAD2_02953 [Pseudovibrio axinellae]SER46117.1 hypothetical protein SAMN05421798_110129 [Pseudovibrio axinellae]